MKKKLKLAFIVKASKRRSEFRKRKSFLLKKLEEFTTLCGVKAGAMVYGRQGDKGDGPEVWPSPEGFEEVVSTFMALQEGERVNNMMDHASYLEDRIKKEEEKLKRLRDENRESKLKKFMFDCLEGKKKVNKCDVKDLRDFSAYINDYMHQLNTRIEQLKIIGESSPLDVEEPYRPVTPMEKPVQHQTPVTFNGQTQHGTNSNQNMDLDINQQGSFISLLMQQMGNVGEHAVHMPFMDDDNNNKPPPTTNPRQGSFMSLLMQYPQQIGYIGDHAAHMNEDNHREPPPTTDH